MTTAEKILDALSDRSGFDDLLSNLDDEVKNEILEEISKIVKENEKHSFVAGYKCFREKCEEMDKYPFDEAAIATAVDGYYTWLDNNRQL